MTSWTKGAALCEAIETSTKRSTKKIWQAISVGEGIYDVCQKSIVQVRNIKKSQVHTSKHFIFQDAIWMPDHPWSVPALLLGVRVRAKSECVTMTTLSKMPWALSSATNCCKASLTSPNLGPTQRFSAFRIGQKMDGLTKQPAKGVFWKILTRSSQLWWVCI